MNASRWVVLSGLALLALGVTGGLYLWPTAPDSSESAPRKRLHYKPNHLVESSGVLFITFGLKSWNDPTSLEEIRQAYAAIAPRTLEQLDATLSRRITPEDEVKCRIMKAGILLYEGEPKKACEVLQETREMVEDSDTLAEDWLYTVIYFQGVAGLRRGETENCIDCRGEGACIFPLRPSAVHTIPAGSRQAIASFTEYLRQFPDDLGVRWLLNLAYMTLGEYPSAVPREYLLTFDNFGTEMDIGRFKDIAHLAGVNRLNMAGGAIMDDFDNDGFLDLVVSSWGRRPGHGPVPQQRGWHVRGSLQSGRDRQAVRRLQPRPDRLQQRRLPRYLRVARRLAGVSHAAIASAQQRRRHLHRRDASGRPDGPGQLPQRLLGRLRQRWLSRPVRLPRARSQPAIPQQGRRHL